MRARHTDFDPYRALGVGRDASLLEIRRAYRRLARRQHPDLNSRPDGAERFAALTEAYELLHDSAARARYDRAARSRDANAPPRVARDASRRTRPADPSIVRRGILTLSPEEAERSAHVPLRLTDEAGFVITLPAGTRDGDQLMVVHRGHVVLLSVRVRAGT